MSEQSKIDEIKLIAAMTSNKGFVRAEIFNTDLTWLIEQQEQARNNLLGIPLIKELHDENMNFRRQLEQT